MLSSRRTRVTLAVVSLLALLAGGYAAAQSMAVGSGDIVADRQRLMKLNGASLKDLNDKLKAGQVEAMAVNAETLAINAQHIPSLFPKGSIEFDCALLMRGIRHEWHGKSDLCCAESLPIDARA